VKVSFASDVSRTIAALEELVGNGKPETAAAAPYCQEAPKESPDSRSALARPQCDEQQPCPHRSMFAEAVDPITRATRHSGKVKAGTTIMSPSAASAMLKENSYPNRKELYSMDLLKAR